MEIVSLITRGKTEDVRKFLASHKDIPRSFNGGLYENTLLRIAAKSNYADIELLQLILQYEQKNITKPSRSLNDSLSAACRVGNLEKVKFLVKNGAKVTFIDKYGWSPLLNAGYSLFTPDLPTHDILKYLVSEGADPDVSSTYNESAIGAASGLARFDTVKLLLDLGASIAPLRWDEVMYAIVFDTLDDVKSAFKKAGKEIRDKQGRRRFLLSLVVGDKEKAQFFVDNGDNATQKGHCGKSPLSYAMTHDNVDMLAWLYENHPIDIDDLDDFAGTALMNAAKHGYAKCLQYLLDQGADLTLMNHTDMHVIDYAYTIETIDILINAGADIDHIDGEGYSLLKTFAENGNAEMVTYLIDKGADVNNTQIGDIALHAATRFDHIDIMKILIDEGSNVSQKDCDFWTPLHNAQSLDAANLLLEAGADTEIVSYGGKKPLDDWPDRIM